MSDIRATLVKLTREAVCHIVNSDDLALEEIFRHFRVSRVDLERVIRRYGRGLVIPPESAYVDICPIKVDGEYESEWAVDVPLWTEEEGRSDLSIQFTIVLDKEPPLVMIDDCRVM